MVIGDGRTPRVDAGARRRSGWNFTETSTSVANRTAPSGITRHPRRRTVATRPSANSPAHAAHGEPGGLGPRRAHGADGVDLVHALGAAAHERRLGAGEVVAHGLAAQPADGLHQVVGQQLPASSRRAAVGGWIERRCRSARWPRGTVVAPGHRSAGCGRCRRCRRARSVRPTSGPAGRRRCGPCAAVRPVTSCPPGRCRVRRRGAARRRRPPARPSPCAPARARSGSGPSPGTAGGSSTSSMYSALPMKNARRGIDCSRATESKNEMWLAATITPPCRGTLSLSTTRTRVSPRYSGVVIALITPVRPLRLLPPGHGAEPSATRPATIRTAVAAVRSRLGARRLPPPPSTAWSTP